jgi:hypothetical protein
MTLKRGVVIVLALIAFAVLMRITADVFDISCTEAGWIALLIAGISRARMVALDESNSKAVAMKTMALTC